MLHPDGVRFMIRTEGSRWSVVHETYNWVNNGRLINVIDNKNVYSTFEGNGKMVLKE
jgi:hypothetical protein